MTNKACRIERFVLSKFIPECLRFHRLREENTQTLLWSERRETEMQCSSVIRARKGPFARKVLRRVELARRV